jgi:hypothetical protein
MTPPCTPPSPSHCVKSALCHRWRQTNLGFGTPTSFMIAWFLYPCFKNKIKYNVFETSDKQVEWDLLSWVWKCYPQSLDNVCHFPASVRTSVQWLRIALMWDLKQLSSVTGQSQSVATTVHAPIQWLRTAVCVRPDIMSYPFSLDNLCQLNASAYAPFQWLRIRLFVRPT